MWLSYRKNRSAEKNEMGAVTIPGEGGAVLSGAELRDCLVLAPGGYYWSPDYGNQVMISPAGGENVISGVLMGQTEIQPGEVYIKSKGGSAIYLKNDGTVLIKGNVIVNGSITEDGNENS